ncbi:hypothetical protein JZ751_005894 [Albula glossodonta]|uniref:Uncharacterized protein n=1 Tax=Albula glossodonta TaxID=121402 RepID=A0A8T2PDZ7_9TELE|nr:hypothetical protein JZ751_005894 [Albula glossodonta]
MLTLSPSVSRVAMVTGVALASIAARWEPVLEVDPWDGSLGRFRRGHQHWGSILTRDPVLCQKGGLQACAHCPSRPPLTVSQRASCLSLMRLNPVVRIFPSERNTALIGLEPS